MYVFLLKALRVLALLLISEALALAALIAVYVVVERDLCPSEFFASGHCYANWFGVFEWMFLSVALIVTSCVFFGILAKGLFCESPKLIGYTVWLTTLLIILFMAISGLRLFTQAIAAVFFVHLLYYQLLAGIEK